MSKVYNIQCYSHGPCGTVRPGHKLYGKCVQREAEGLLDALCVNNDPENCPECAEEQAKRDREDLSYFEARRTEASSWYDPAPLSEKMQAELDALLKRMGISKKCWNCSDYGGYSVCMDCQRDGNNWDEEDDAVRADDSASQLAEGAFEDVVNDLVDRIEQGLANRS